ncbi:HAD family hydrolase [Streptomyces sp. NPDC052396]|uniref:HAD family hydrolase n=1 Tax=Streptomyces sp. NPDC052396 TaxID=3365689 RepID=UPI0037D87E1B
MQPTVTAGDHGGVLTSHQRVLQPIPQRSCTPAHPASPVTTIVLRPTFTSNLRHRLFNDGPRLPSTEEAGRGPLRARGRSRHLPAPGAQDGTSPHAPNAPTNSSTSSTCGKPQAPTTSGTWPSNKLEPAADMVAVARAARAAGYKIAMLSNSFGLHPYNPYEALGVWDLFDVTVVSERERVAKPDPAIYRTVLDRLGLPGEACVFVDDYERNLPPAREAGMTTVLARPGTGAVARLETLLGIDGGCTA